MNRQAIQALNNWKNNPNRKPLIIRGARQVGKTWIMKEFGNNAYKQVAYVNFESSKLLKTQFEDNFDINRIITAIQIETDVQINADSTLIIFDEIQEASGAITSLKYFCENAPQYHIIAAGSMRGVALHANTSFPVGKVEFLDLYPLSFTEYLIAMDQQPLLDLLNNTDWSLVKAFKQKYIALLREYYYIGGMPEVVNSFRLSRDFAKAREIQKQILTVYELDFSKHAPSEIVPRIRLLWKSVLSQLAKENKKFIYSAVKTGSRAKDYELALSWLTDCGLIHQICRISKQGLPLKAYEDHNAFKLFIVDVGLLGAMGNLDVKTLLEGNRIFEEFKGAMTEQFVLQQLMTNPEITIYYWSNDQSSAELDFLIQYAGQVIPIEVKAEENLHAKSLKTYYQKYLPNVAIRTSMSDYRTDDWLTNLPLYSIGHLNSIFKQ